MWRSDSGPVWGKSWGSGSARRRTHSGPPGLRTWPQPSWGRCRWGSGIFGVNNVIERVGLDAHIEGVHQSLLRDWMEALRAPARRALVHPLHLPTGLRTDSGPSAICYDWKSVQHTSLPARRPTYNLDHVRVSHPIATRRSSELTMGRSSGRMGGSVGDKDCAASSRVFSAAAEVVVRHPPAAHLVPLARVTADFERAAARGVEQDAWRSTARRACLSPVLSMGNIRGER